MNETKKNKETKKIIIAIVALVAVIAIFVGVYSSTKEAPVEGQKEIVVEVVHGDGSEKEFEIITTKEYLGDALLDEKLIEGEDGEFGIFITAVDGEIADDANQEWWCATKGGEMMQNSVSQEVLEDGAQYELTLTVGY